MANYENIRPYSEKVHEMAAGGGVDKYFDDYAKANQKIGAQKQKEADTNQFAALAGLAVPVVIMLWEGGKKLYRFRKDKLSQLNKEKALLIEQSEQAKTAILQSIDAPSTEDTDHQGEGEK